MKCPYCSAGPTHGRSTTTPGGRGITECSSCGRVLSEHQTQTHHLFHLRAQDSPLLLSTSDLPSPGPHPSSCDDPFQHTGFITAFSTWSLEHCPLFALSSFAFAGHLAELERAMDVSGSGSASGSGSGVGSGGVVVDNLRAYLQVVDVGSILRLERDVMDHAFQLFRECSSATFLRNRSVEALATACLVQAIREAQEPRTLQEISIAANLPQKEIGKYIKILGEALQLSQPINSNSIAVHMPRFCNLLQLNKSAQELATHIGEVVMNKCFCTRRNPISISAAAIYLACQLEDRRKTQAEICKVTGLTEVTLRKVYKELLENWDDLLPSNYTPVVPPEKAFPTTTIASGRSAGPRSELPETAVLDREKQPPETKPLKSHQPLETSHQDKGKGEVECKNSAPNSSKTPTSWKPGAPFATNTVKTSGENQNANQGTGLSKSNPTSKGISLNNNKSVASSTQELGQKMTGVVTEGKSNNAHVTTQKGTTSWRPGFPFPPMPLKTSGVIQSPNQNQGMISNLKKSSSNAQEVDQKFFGSMRSNPFVAAKVFGASSTARATLTSAPLAHVQSSQSGQYQTTSSSSEANEAGKCNEGRGSDPDRGR